MKKYITLLVLSFALSMNAFASEKTYLQCSTPGDAIGAVDVLTRADGVAVVRVTDLDDSPAVEFIIQSGMKDVMKKTSATVIAQEADGNDFGGGQSKAVLLQVLSGQKSAKFASNGFVYHLQCNLK